MTENQDKDLVLKDQVSLKFTSRPHETKIKFSKWYAAQHNVQNSILSIVEHMIDRFGYVDVCDHEIAKKLHTEMLHFNGQVTPEVKITEDEFIPSKDTKEPVEDGQINKNKIQTQTFSEKTKEKPKEKLVINKNNF